MNKYLIVFLFIIITTSSCRKKTDLNERIHAQLESPGSVFNVHESPAKKFILEFYELRDYDELWVEDFNINRRGKELMKMLQNAHHYGLDTAYYGYRKIEATALQMSEAKKKDEKKAAATATELMLTNAYMLMAAHLHSGLLDEKSFKIKWKGDKLDFNLAEYLNDSGEKNNITQSLEDLQPQHVYYRNLKKALNKYLEEFEINEERVMIPSPKQDSIGAYIAAIQALHQKKYLASTDVRTNAVIEAIKSFQGNNGIEVDGILGENTIEALQRSTYDEYIQIALNLEKLRWETNFPDYYIYVNVPSFHLRVVEDEKVQKDFKVIVGKPEHPTPELTKNMTHIILHPEWHVPFSISVREILPAVKKNINHFEEKKYVLLDKQNTEIDPAEVDWESVDSTNFEYKIKQVGGQHNSLGQIKFMFPNEYAVYVHDTPGKDLFSQDIRSESHGCVRLHKPMELAEYLLKKDNNKVKPKQLEEIIAGEDEAETQINLKTPVPVLIRYFTCEADEDGKVYFYKDIYNHDKKLRDKIVV